MPSSKQNSRESPQLECLSAWQWPSPGAEGRSAYAEFACGASYGGPEISLAALLFLEAIRDGYVEEVVNREAVQPG